MYYILLTDIENDREDAILEGEFTDVENEDYSFESGISLLKKRIDLPVIFNIDEFALRGTMTDHLCTVEIPGPVFSLKSKNVLDMAGITNIEYYPLQLLDEFPDGKEDVRLFKFGKNTVEYTNYFIANVVGLVDCVDHNNSELEYFYPPELRNQQQQVPPDDYTADPFAIENPNDIDFITKLVIDENKIDPALKMFRLSDQPDLLLFHESVVDQIKKAKLSGFVFVPVSEYTEVIPDDDNAEMDEKKDVEPENKPVERKKPGFAFSLD